MIFPAINISTTKWIEDDLMEYVIYDNFIYTNEESLFYKFYENQFFCDGNGKIFKAVRKSETIKTWRKWLRFIPNIWKIEIIYENTNKELSIEQLRNFLLTRVSDLNQNEFIKEWKIDIKNAKTYMELINDRKK